MVQKPAMVIRVSAVFAVFADGAALADGVSDAVGGCCGASAVALCAAGIGVSTTIAAVKKGMCFFTVISSNRCEFPSSDRSFRLAGNQRRPDEQQGQEPSRDVPRTFGSGCAD